LTSEEQAPHCADLSTASSDSNPGEASSFLPGGVCRRILECQPTNVAPLVDGEIACGSVQYGKSTGTL
jgi:hypothetical protein